MGRTLLQERRYPGLTDPLVRSPLSQQPRIPGIEHQDLELWADPKTLQSYNRTVLQRARNARAGERSPVLHCVHSWMIQAVRHGGSVTGSTGEPVSHWHQTPTYHQLPAAQLL